MSLLRAPQDNGKRGGRRWNAREVNEDREGLRLHPVTDPDHLSVRVCACVSTHSWKTTSRLPRTLPAEGFSRCNVRLIWPILSPRDSLRDLGPPASVSVCTEKTSNKDTSSRTKQFGDAPACIGLLLHLKRKGVANPTSITHLCSIIPVN